MNPIRVGKYKLGAKGRPFFIAGPCVIESERHCLKTAERLAEYGEKLQVDIIFKASYDKANRTSLGAYRGPGLDEGLRILEKARLASGLPILSDVHETWQVWAAMDVLDVIQIPAFLCRQTDLVQAAAETGLCVNLKKGQFLSPQEMGKVLEKALAAENPNVMLTERGTSFGYNTLVVDFRSFATLRSFGHPVIFDVTHSVQSPGGLGVQSGGTPEFIPDLARAGAAVGVDGFFFEVHENPAKALSDGANTLNLKKFPALVEDILNIRAVLDKPPRARAGKK
ncbi:MAG: 3-deoxy-8-phosphooctulonate synthase [Acidobacteriota bacterium]|jgi:2-dehydro-3-deoxyphosphooctonate aldolase (KDO 8-P synthase)|nr:3-deoxy-8-phosphooctulonate synthase [Acidobacteriota bacterium]